MSDNESENGSSRAIVAIAKSRTRYKHQDLLLMGFLRMPGSTAKEVAAEYYDWKYERYADSPKRAADLSSPHFGYLEQLENRKCRRSGKEAHTYRITQRGIDHLVAVGLVSSGDSVGDTGASSRAGRVSFDAMRSALGS